MGERGTCCLTYAVRYIESIIQNGFSASLQACLQGFYQYEEGMKVIFAHGFEGSPQGSKPTYMQETLGWSVDAVDMPRLGWSIQNQSDALLQTIDDTHDFDLLVGSSMGGLAAANASARRPDRNFKVILLAPAFGLHGLWNSRLNQTQLDHWKRTKKYNYVGFSIDIWLGWDFMESAERMSWPSPSHPTVIIHGSSDDTVPIANSRKAAHESPAVNRLIEVQDEHRLQGSLPTILTAAEILAGSG